VMMPETVCYFPSYNRRPGDMMQFLSSHRPHEFSSFRFGMTPGNYKEDKPIFDAPVEGDRHVTDDGILKKGIIQSALFRKQIREQRGILPLDYFIVENAEGKPYLVFLKEKKRPIGLACVWDCWKKDILDPLVYGFSVITVPVFGEFLNAGITRLPLILNDRHYKRWLKTDGMLTLVSNLLQPFPEELINAFPISDEILSNADNDRSLINPVGDVVISEKINKYEYERPRKKYKGESGNFQARNQQFAKEWGSL